MIKKTSKKKVVTQKDMEIKTNCQGIRVMGLISGMSADGESRGAQPRSSLSTKEMILAKKSSGKLTPRNVCRLSLMSHDRFLQVIPLKKKPLVLYLEWSDACGPELSLRIIALCLLFKLLVFWSKVFLILILLMLLLKGK